MNRSVTELELPKHCPHCDELAESLRVLLTNDACSLAALRQAADALDRHDAKNKLLTQRNDVTKSKS